MLARQDSLLENVMKEVKYGIAGATQTEHSTILSLESNTRATKRVKGFDKPSDLSYRMPSFTAKK
jgi:hypothetical protein